MAKGFIHAILSFLLPGRVQSVALRLVCDREAEIQNFKKQEFWTIEAEMSGPNGQRFAATLTHLNGQKLKKFAFADCVAAQKAVDSVKETQFSVKSITSKNTARHPLPPFITSTMQTAASNTLGFSVMKTMSLAQELYEGTDAGE